MPDLSVATVELKPGGNVNVGDSLIITAFPRTADGTLLGGRLITWSSADTSILAVRPNGIVAIVRAKSPGSVEISADVEGKTGKVTVNVTTAPLVIATVAIVPSIGALEVGKQFTVHPVLRTADSTIIVGRTVAWQSSDPTIATITASADGAFATLIAHRVGDVVITATVEGKQAQRTIQIKPPSPVAGVFIEPDSLLIETTQEFELEAKLYDANGQPISWNGVLWYSSDNTIADIKSVNGQRATILTYRPGTALIIAEAGGKTARVTLKVQNPGNVGFVFIQGGSNLGLAIWNGQVMQLKATVMARAGGELHGQPVHWEVEDRTIAEVRADGQIRALKPGTTHVFAKSGGIRDFAFLTVYPYPANGMTLTLRAGMDLYGLPRVLEPVGTTTWTDENGIVRAAKKYLVRGTLKVGTNGIDTYEQHLEIETWVAIPGMPARVVDVETVIDRGNVFYGLTGLLRDVYLTSTITGQQVHARFDAPGRLVVPQTIGSALSVDYFYEVE